MCYLYIVWRVLFKEIKTYFLVKTDELTNNAMNRVLRGAYTFIAQKYNHFDLMNN